METKMCRKCEMLKNVNDFYTKRAICKNCLKLKTKIVFLIYEELLWAPQKEEILNPDRFVMMFAPISRTFKKSYQMPKELPASPAYVRNKITLPVNLEENLSFLSQWQKAFNGEL